MSRTETIKCDRCGKTIEGIAPCFEVVIEMKRGYDAVLLSDCLEEDFDLCQDCWKEIRPLLLSTGDA